MEKPTDPASGHQPAEKPEPQICVDCGYITYEPRRIGTALSGEGTGRDIYACPLHASRYGLGGAL